MIRRFGFFISFLVVVFFMPLCVDAIAANGFTDSTSSLSESQDEPDEAECKIRLKRPGGYDTTMNFVSLRNLCVEKIKSAGKTTALPDYNNLLPACHQPVSTGSTQPVDTIIATNDTAKKHSPLRAALFSAVVPGLGQIYNKQYWKVPIIYAGGAVAGYLIYYNYTVYANVHKSYRYRKDTFPDTVHESFVIKQLGKDDTIQLADFSDSDVLQLRTAYRRNLDLSILLAFGIYAVNIIDAVVFAHLYDFDVSEDLTLRVKPDFQYTHAGDLRPAMQLGLTYRF